MLINGGADGVRTHDLLDAIEARSQLRHGPTGGTHKILPQDDARVALVGTIMSFKIWTAKEADLKDQRYIEERREGSAEVGQEGAAAAV
jgi:hypothetical protein